MINRNELDEVIESFGLSTVENHNNLFGIFNKWTILIYDKGNRKVCVWETDNTGFGNYIKDKETFKEKLGDYFKWLKENKMKQKLEKIEEMFL